VLSAFALALCAQSGPAKGATTKASSSWNEVPPKKAAYVNITKRPAPRRDLSGIWNGEAEGGVQANGALEHSAVTTDNAGNERRAPADENSVAHPLPYTPAGLEALRRNKPIEGIGERFEKGEDSKEVSVCL
jgi:hypothetical protein